MVVRHSLVGKRKAQYILGGFSLLLVGLLGCATKQLAREAGEGAVKGAVQAAADQKTRQELIRQILDDPELKKAGASLAYNLIQGGVSGGLDALQNRAEGLAQEMVRAGGRAFREQGALLGPDVERSLRRTLVRTILASGTALRKSAEKDLSIATSVLIKAAVEGFLDGVSAHADQLGPKASALFQQNVLPGVESLGYRLVLGMGQGLKEVMKSTDPNPSALRLILREAGAGLGEGLGEGLAKSVTRDPIRPVLIIAVAGLGALLIAAIVVGIVLWRRYSQATQSLFLFANQLNQPLAPGSTNTALMQAIRESHEAANRTAWLEKFLRSRGLYRPTSSSE